MSSLRIFVESHQLYFYHWAVKQEAAKNPDGPFGMFNRVPVCAFIDGIFLKSTKEHIFKRSDVFQFKQYDCDLFAILLNNKIKELVQLWHNVKSGHVAMPTGLIQGRCAKGFRCRFFDVCSAPDEIARRHVLNKQFVSKPYDPIKLNLVDE